MAAPVIATGTGATLTAWTALDAPDRSAALVSGCVAVPIPGWVEEMRPAATARTTALAGASAEGITRAAVDARPADDGTLVLRPASHLAGPDVGTARTFLGFDDAHVFGCFVTCARRPTPASSAATGELGCEDVVASARLENSSAPPAPGLALRVATWAVHHPRDAATVSGLLVLAAAVTAVMTRRRPRFVAR